MSEICEDSTTRRSSETSLEQLVRGSAASVRLLNCIGGNPEIGRMSVRDFLNAGDTIARKLLETRNLGRKTFDELCDLVREHSQAAPSSSGEPIPDGTDEEHQLFNKFISLFNKVPFPAVVLQYDISSRLRNVLQTFEAAQQNTGGWETEILSLGDLIAGWPIARSKMLKITNSGRRTILELENLVQQTITNLLRALIPLGEGVPTVALAELTLGNMVGSVGNLIQRIGKDALLDKPSAEDIARLSVSWSVIEGAELQPRDAIRQMISELPAKERDVVLRRYGLDEFETHTLEEVAKEFFVTRERVRQVGAKGLKRLSLGSKIGPFRKLLEIEQSSIWNQLSGGSDLLLPLDLQGYRGKLSAEVVLSIDVVYEDCSKWAAHLGQPFYGGWLRGSHDPDAIRKRISVFAEWADNLPGPVPVALLPTALNVSASDLAVISRINHDAHIFEGYVCPGHLGSQAKRTCRLHNLAQELFGEDIFDLATLRAAYGARFPEDDVAQRILLLQLQRAPHLFARVFDSIWVTLGNNEDRRGSKQLQAIPYFRTDSLEPTEFEARSIGGRIYEALSVRGPMRVVDLRRLLQNDESQKVADSSIGAILHMNPEFARLGPGIYGFQRHIGNLLDPDKKVPGAFLTEKQCRYYAMSRAAGDPVNLYPAWSFHLEASLCRWAWSGASSETSAWILAISAPERWSLDVREQEVWCGRKRAHGRIPVPLATPSMTLPDASDFIAAAIFLQRTGSIAWTSVNRTAQRRLDSTKSASTLALLVAFGLASSEDHWQKRHKITDGAHAVISQISTELSDSGIPSWNEGHLGELSKTTLSIQPGWCTQEVCEAILDRGRGESSFNEHRGLGDLDAIFQSDDWGADFITDVA